MNGYKEEILRGYLAHGTPWKKHKYIRKEGNKYIYDNASNPEAHKAAVKAAIAEDANYAHGIRTHENNELFKMKKAAELKEELRKEHLESGKNYSKQIGSQKYQEEQHRKDTEKERKRNLKAKKVSKDIEQKKREEDQARQFDRDAKKRRNSK